MTGGAGFIGSHLVARLLRDGASRVVMLDSADAVPARGGVGDDARLQTIRHRLGRDSRTELIDALQGVDWLVHLAAEKHRPSLDAPDELLATNVVGTRQLFECAAAARVRKIVFASSLYAYGRLHAPAMDEDECPQPSTLYGISKLCGEQLLRLYCSDGGPSGDVLRFFFVYGPGQYAGTGYKSVIVQSFERLARSEAPVINGDGLQALDYVFIDDVVEAVVRCLQAPGGGRVLNVGSGQATRVGDLVAAICGVAGFTTEPRTAPADWTRGTYRVGRIERARAELGWAPTIGLSEGLRRTWESMRSTRS